jgi:hypothetical protein
MRNKFTKKITITKEEFKKLYYQKTNKELAKELNVSLVYFYQLLRNYGLVFKNKKTDIKEEVQIKVEKTQQEKIIAIAIDKAKKEVEAERTKLIHPLKKQEMLDAIDDAAKKLDYQDLLNQDFSKYGENGYFAFFKSRFKSRINDHLTKNK